MATNPFISDEQTQTAAQKLAEEHYSETTSTLPKMVQSIAQTSERIVARVNTMGYDQLVPELSPHVRFTAMIAAVVGQLGERIGYLPDSAIATIEAQAMALLIGTVESPGLLIVLGGPNPTTFRRVRAPVAIDDLPTSQAAIDAIKSEGFAADDLGLHVKFRELMRVELPAAIAAFYAGQTPSIPAYAVGVGAAWLTSLDGFPADDAQALAAYILEVV